MATFKYPLMQLKHSLELRHYRHGNTQLLHFNDRLSPYIFYGQLVIQLVLNKYFIVVVFLIQDEQFVESVHDSHGD